MNIFYLDRHPRLCAEYHCDKHVVKMILESAQLMSTAHHVLGSWQPSMLKPTHVNHPCAVWVRDSFRNYVWTLSLFNCLLAEYHKRNHKEHLYRKHHMSAILGRPTPKFKKLEFTPPPLCMPDEFKDPSGDPVRSYRNYYALGKMDIVSYNRSPNGVPSWFKEYQ